MNKKFQYLIIFASILSIIILTLNSIINRRYNFISIILVFLSCLPFYFSYENRKPHTREVVVISIMVTLTIISRILFALIPGFKPMMAMVIICGMVFGQEHQQHPSQALLRLPLTSLIQKYRSFYGRSRWISPVCSLSIP